ncbi:DUF4864 domain-containing protein [Mesorhizobium sp. IMUNJ 23232]|uniref:DUF4864 domain-containing protein n=1 Tax=Mesorhizobium sp. IMUNJ 23232 TaxID=3376064 RepID=UPI0037B5C102
MANFAQDAGRLRSGFAEALGKSDRKNMADRRCHAKPADPNPRIVNMGECAAPANASQRTTAMRRMFLALLLLPLLSADALAGEAEIKAAQDTIGAQIEAFKRGDNAAAYGYAAPGIKKIFPTLETFMGMVTGAYQPVYKPQSYAFGKSEEMGATSVIQQVLIVGPDGKDYEAVYTLERQPDGTYKITGVSLKASKTLST